MEIQTKDIDVENNSSTNFRQADHYKQIYEQYNAYKNTATVRLFETPTFLRLLGDIKGLDCIDLACGAGFYTVLLRERTDGKVYGVDLSPNMIEIAQNVHKDKDITFIQADCADPIEID